MYAFRVQVPAVTTVTAERQHADCPCLTVTISTDDGKVMLDVESAAALEALGLEIAAAAEALASAPIATAGA
jgi:hypothetical protein